MVDLLDIVHRIKKNDSEAFNWLVDEFKDIVFRTAFAFLKNQEESEDITQEVFISVFRNIESFRGEANIKTWILRIAINKSLNQIRKNKWKASVQSFENLLLPAQNKQSSDVNPYQQMKQKELEGALNKALDKLPSQQRSAFVLHKIDELPQQEIAQILNTSVSSVESLIFRAKTNLQKQLYKLYKENLE